MSDKDTKYNGWTNYETWVVKLWMDNEQSSYNHWNHVAEETWEDSEAGKSYSSQTRMEAATCTLSDRLKDEHEEAMPELNNVFADLLNAAMSEVNWYEIAEAILADLELDRADRTLCDRSLL